MNCRQRMFQISCLYICGKMTHDPAVAALRNKYDAFSVTNPRPTDSIKRRRKQPNHTHKCGKKSMQQRSGSKMQVKVVSLFKSNVCSTFVINAVLVTTVCGAFMAGAFCGHLLSTPVRHPCETGKERDSKDPASELNDVVPGQDMKTTTESGREISYIPKDNLTSLLQNWTDVLSLSVKNIVHREIQSVEKKLKRNKCHKGSASLKDVKTSVLVHRITAQLNHTVENLISKNVQEISVGRDPPKKIHSKKKTTTTTAPATDTKKKANKSYREHDKISSCPKGWSIYHGSCYKAHNAHAFQWNIARQACRVERADLVVISSAEENQFVYSLARAQAPTRKYLWLGLFRGSWSEQFFWVDHTPVFYSRWAQNEPNNRNTNGENCVHMYIWKGSKAMQWNDELCVNPSIGSMAYMCEMEATGHSRQVEDGPIWIESDESADAETSGSGDENTLTA